jgi:hypothetical protein
MRPLQVHIRSLQERISFCTCPDRANNQLGAWAADLAPEMEPGPG